MNHKKQSKNFNIGIIRLSTYYKKELNKEEMDDEKESEYKNNKEENKNKMFNEDKNSIYKGENNSYDEKVRDVNRLITIYDIKDSTSDGNSLFNSFSLLIFNNELYSYTIRQKICDFLMEKKIEDDSHIEKMRKNKEYGGESEINAFSLLCNIKITLFIRNINDINQKSNRDKIKIRIYNEHKIGNFSLIMDKYSKNEGFNHFAPCFLKNGSSISSSQMQNIKKIFENYKNNNDFIINDTRKFTFGIESNIYAPSLTLPTSKHNYSFDRVNKFSKIKNDDKNNTFHIGNIIRNSFMDNIQSLTPQKSNCPKQNSLLRNQTSANLNINPTIQKMIEEEKNKIDIEIKKCINDNIKDEKNKKIGDNYNIQIKKKFDNHINKVFIMNEKQEKAKKKREKQDEIKNLELRKKLEEKDNLWKTKRFIDKNYNKFYNDVRRKVNI